LKWILKEENLTQLSIVEHLGISKGRVKSKIHSLQQLRESDNILFYESFN